LGEEGGGHARGVRDSAVQRKKKDVSIFLGKGGIALHDGAGKEWSFWGGGGGGGGWQKIGNS